MTYEIISVSNRFSLSYPVYFNIDPELFMLDISHITHILHGNFAPQTKTKTKIKIRWDTIWQLVLIDGRRVLKILEIPAHHARFA